MGVKNWPHTPGTCRAANWALRSRNIVCHPCRRYVMMPPLEVPYDPCPFACTRCGTRGELKDAIDAPSGYAHQTRLIGREFLAPKLRWKPTR